MISLGYGQNKFSSPFSHTFSAYQKVGPDIPIVG